jgi:hypothetical protein
MNKRTRGFILVTLAISLGAWLTAQSPTFPGIQGFYPAGKVWKGVQVDVNGKLVTTTSGGGCTAPCVVVGKDASGAVPTGSPVLVAGSDGTDVRTLSTDNTGKLNVNATFTPSGTQHVDGSAAVGAAAGNPVTLGTRDDSNNALATHSCPDQAAITLSAGTDVTIISGAMGKTVYICHVDLASNASANMTIRQGTQMTTPCDTSTTALSGAYQNVVTFADDYTPWAPIHTTATALDVCLHFSTSVTIGGWVSYAQY